MDIPSLLQFDLGEMLLMEWFFNINSLLPFAQRISIHGNTDDQL